MDLGRYIARKAAIAQSVICASVERLWFLDVGSEKIGPGTQLMPLASPDSYRDGFLAMPHDTLAALAARLACTSDVAQRLADEALPIQSRSEVMLSPDLLPAILAKFEISERAPMEVCRAWRTAWLDGDVTRRGLRPAIFPALADLSPPPSWAEGGLCDLHALPDNDSAMHGLALAYGVGGVHLVDKCMRTQCSTEILMDAQFLACGQGRLYVSGGLNVIHSFSLVDLSPIASRNFSSDDGGLGLLADSLMIYELAYTPCALFAAALLDDAWTVLHLDPTSLQLRATFGDDDIVGAVSGLCVLGEELYVGGSFNVHVFSLRGEHMRDLTGDWRRPHLLRACAPTQANSGAHGRSSAARHSGGHAPSDDGGRLYLVEEHEQQRSGWSGPGRRIFVLTPRGETLQVYDCAPQLDYHEHPDCHVQAIIGAMDVFDGKLLLHQEFTPSASMKFARANIDGSRGDGGTRMCAVRGL